MSEIFQIFFYQPILNLLVFLYNITPGHDLGVVIILLTIIIKLILLPLSKQSIKSQKALQELQPKIDEIKKKYADDKQKMGKEMMELYKENKVNPFSSCLPLIVQLPVFIAVFKVFKNGMANGALDLVYSFISKPEYINTMSLGFIELSKPNPYLAVLAGLAQFWQAKMMSIKKPEFKTQGSKDESMAVIMNKQMLYFMPVLTIFIGLTLPGGLSLYWFITTVLTGVQQLYVLKKNR
ncbi:MAG: YidC/Oxa1 family membrane protein insertase [Patescibacteria group bacterium]|nr:YidC/Oxa1 family membrane protein insertase [Patescibacteria group bacterium]MBU1160785.1 YidC/Oxa1 family membrane protein insertase [Patescibacteria group bacterium]MBU1349745.1 YidC/Oxa1 family membrane protein insertase [Patescibacteria group bacterium]MBU1421507.1 YidC/Oxa1 family membrane protein insertase [Patescibacteria group bacterium]MBU1683869.1 YidC/Oxa1 family membrane protein insertase [Patescibacteria group bacterium]